MLAESDIAECSDESLPPPSFFFHYPLMGPVRIRHSSHDFGWQSSHSVDLAGWQAKMASIEIWIQWRNAHKPHFTDPTECCFMYKHLAPCTFMHSMVHWIGSLTSVDARNSGASCDVRELISLHQAESDSPLHILNNHLHTSHHLSTGSVISIHTLQNNCHHLHSHLAV